MKLEVGKKYNQRGGGVEEIVRKQCGPDWPWVGASGWAYDDQGRVKIDKSPCDDDLISEYVEPGICPTCKNGARISPCPECSTAKPAIEYGPWIAWNGGDCPLGENEWAQIQLDDETREDVIKEDDELLCDQCGWELNPGIIAYRVVIEPETVDYIWVCGDGDAWSAKWKGTRKVAITVKGDSINAEWAE